MLYSIPTLIFNTCNNLEAQSYTTALEKIEAYKQLVTRPIIDLRLLTIYLMQHTEIKSTIGNCSHCFLYKFHSIGKSLQTVQLQFSTTKINMA